ncbi:kinase-like protein [Lophiostoma macrostomum CBS 122681]|uniref:Kinase-like protein n=1 Tax=Lophiostoma macrostomum CBS 122681 TaxID=1314788 RepID=A0A6A6THW0_9PLEO|nr:kinase-like protein [Lophiostoma macrostomum CBS 122681]
MNAQVTDAAAGACADFDTQLKACTVKPNWTDGGDFIQVQKLCSWMRAQSAESGSSNAHRLLRAVYGTGILPIQSTQICERGRDRCILIFSILLEIGLGKLIYDVQQSVTDVNLPVDLGKLKDVFQPHDPNGSLGCATKFDEAQYKYGPITFRWDTTKHYDAKCVVPICRKQVIGRGGQGEVYKILVQEEYVCEQLREQLPHDEHTRIEDPEYGKCFQFALKTFSHSNLNFFAEEKAAFDGLKNNKGIRRYLGSYEHFEKPRTPGHASMDRPVMTRNILLEYGEFSLRDILMDRLPPVFAVEIKDFWSHLIELVDALRGMHRLRIGGEEYSVWHNDIKPGNIIVVNDDYKLADLGLARFEKRSPKNGDKTPTIEAPGGTRTYGAPECYATQGGARRITQSTDIWSIGCVFSMAATWLVLGHQYIPMYTRLRQKAIEGLQSEGVSQGDFFHNGHELLPQVKQWHEFLRKSTRHTDTITAPLLDLVEKYALTTAGNRLSAEILYQEMKRIVGGAVEEPGPQMEGLLDTLLCIDEEAPSNLATSQNWQSPAGGPSGRDQLVPDRFALRKTVSRLEALSKVARAQPSGTAPKSNVEAINYSGALYNQPPGALPSTTDKRASTFPPVARNSIADLHCAPQIPTHEPQNVIQAREQMASGKWSKITRRHDPDSLLKEHFDNRDIKFLVDNASSMIPYWDEATFVLETLARKASPYDRDGMDLYFTVGSSTVTEKKDSGSFRTAMYKNPPKDTFSPSDITSSLETIFSEYFEKQRSKPNLRKKRAKEAVTLIVLTDGIWAATENDEEIFSYIKIVLEQLEELKIPNHAKRPASIEFVQFGNDPDVTERLRALDDGLPERGFKDIIDHEQFSIQGDVRKMLLGSFVPFIDRNEPSPQRTSTSHSPASAYNNNQSTMYGESSSALRAGRGIRTALPGIMEQPYRTPPQSPERT